MSYKTVNGKLVKTTAVRTLNEQTLTKVLEKMAIILIEEDDTVGYDSNDNMCHAAKATILAYNLKTRELQDLLVFRDKFEAIIDKHHTIKRSTGLMAVTQDIGELYKSRGVPQTWQVMSGLLDSIIGELFVSTQEAA